MSRKTQSNGNGKHIGRLIKQARKKKHLKAEDVAVRCNVSRSRVYQWELSKSVLPKNLKSLSEALDISLKRLRDENRV